ncbi:MAG: hypothetical protein IPL08_21510 [Saprospiraceae bacterium]|nr:hypothetical protein [Saprospiraceae bacterium]
MSLHPHYHCHPGGFVNQDGGNGRHRSLMANFVHGQGDESGI